MAFFIPQVKPRLLPVVGDSIERSVMDWKVKPAAKAFERAKDVAAFANHHGGTLLIGAAESGGQLSKYVGLSPTDAGSVRSDYSQSVDQRCLPRPTIDFEEYEDPIDPTKRIVAVNVWPSLNLVGVRFDAAGSKDGYGGIAYVYPVRSGTDASYLTPAEIPMYMTPHVRRMAVMLSRISKGSRVKVLRAPEDESRRTDSEQIFDSIVEEENVARFNTMTGTPSASIPLDLILSVYETPNGATNIWRIVVRF